MKAKTIEIKSDVIHSILSEIDYEFDRNGGDIPRFIIDFLFEVDELQSILEEYNVSPENIREVLLTGQMFRNQPTLDECIKEWEEKGFEVKQNSKHYLYLANSDKNIKVFFRKFELSYVVEDFYNDGNRIITHDIHSLIHKTLKALENNNETK